MYTNVGYISPSTKKMEEIDDFSFDQDGIPTVDDLSSTSDTTPTNRPSPRPRPISHRHDHTDTTSTRPNHQQTHRRGPSRDFAPEIQHVNNFSNEADFADIFDILGEGYDCNLSFSEGVLTWKPMNPMGHRRPLSTKKGLKNLFKNNSKKVALKKNSLRFREILGVKLRRRKQSGQKDGEGICLGFGLLTYDFKNANVMKARMIDFEHPSEEICNKWVSKISDILQTFEERPKSVKLFIQKYAGEKTGMALFREKILPIMRTADCNVDMTEVVHNEQIKQDLIHLNLLDYDCIVCMGGDGTVNKVVNGLLNQSHKDYGIEMKRNINPVKATISMGIIPTGKTNHIASSVMGTDDPITGLLHILYGNRYMVDVCSVYHNDKFQRWAFNSQYGFAGNVLTFISRYSSIGLKKVEASFLKALTKSKLRSYECDIEYIPMPGAIAPMTCTRCTTHCKVCTATSAVHNDEVEEFNPLHQSGSTSSLIDLAENSENSWRTIKGDFMNVGIFTVPGICEFAPQGLSKFTHLNDGCMDLVVVKNVERKDFIRFLRRHGNSKNQFDFPFVETFRVKEVRFRPRFPTSWNYKDHDFSEIDYEMSKISTKQKFANRSKSMQVINDLGNEEITSISSSTWDDGGRKRAGSVMTLQGLSIDSDAEDSDLPNESIRGSSYNIQQSQSNLVGPQYRMTLTEKERLKRKKHQRKKEEKQKGREERKMKSVWNIDNEIHKDLELDFKVHHGLLTIAGIGVNPHTPLEEVKFGCLPP